MTQELTIALGQSSLLGKRAENEDFYGCVTPDGETLAAKGIAMAVADGVGGGAGGRQAAEVSVKSFLTDYYSTPDTWSVSKCLEQVLKQVNTWIYTEGSRNPECSGMATTFSALVLKGRRFDLAHAGDSRIYLLRDGRIVQLTQDHTWDHPDKRQMLYRAIGLDAHLCLDHRCDSLCEHDVFLLCSDGLHGVLDDKQILNIVAHEHDMQAAAEQLTHAALQAGGNDNITAQLVRIEHLPDERYGDLHTEISGLPFAEEVREGKVLDDFHLIKCVHHGHMAFIYKAEDKRSGEMVALKFPNLRYIDDASFMDRFLREEWVSKRIRSEYVLGALPIEPGRRTRLYYAMPFFGGETLRQRLQRKSYIGVNEVVDIGIQVCKGLFALHRHGIIHRDIKPENILVTKDGAAKIIDLGVSLVASQGSPGDEGGGYTAPGTPPYMAPEMFRGEPGDERTDIYALGATLYELLTRKYPYGDIEPFSRPRFTRWVPPSRYNPEIPGWLEAVLQKATEADPERRYEVVSGMQFHLERPEQARTAPINRALLERDPAAAWKIATFLFGLLAGIELILLAGGS